MKYFLIALALSATGAVLVNNNHRSENGSRTFEIDGTYDVYKNLNDAEAGSPLIIVGNIKGDFSDARFFSFEQGSGVPYAEREIVITKVIKNSLPIKYKSGDKITLIEPTAILNDNDGRKTLYRLGDYIGIEKSGGPIVFFLTKSGFNGKYSITNMNLSRIPLSQNDISGFYSNKSEEKVAMGILKEMKNKNYIK